MPKVLLTIEDLSEERNTIIIFKEHFEVMEPQDFGLEDQARLSRIGKLFMSYEVSPGEELTEQEAKEAKAAIDALVLAIIPDLADRPDIFKKLKDYKKVDIVKAFTQAVKEKKAEAPAPQTLNRANRRSR